MSTVWIVWVGEHAPDMEGVWASEASARKAADDLRRAGITDIAVEEVEVQP